MKAIVYSSYGSPDVLRCEEVDRPAAGDDDVVMKVCAASVNPLDWHLIRGTPYILRATTGLRKPNTTRPGVDVAGRVEAVGKNVSQFKPGDRVFGTCRGAFAEYASTSELGLVKMPDKVTFEQAAAVPIAAFTALQGLRDKGRVQQGQKVLINGAAGGVGTLAVQIASSFGAEVTGVCSTKNVDMVRSIGASRVIDYSQEDFTRSGDNYDLIFDLVGNHSLMAYRRVMNPGGIYLAAGALGSSITKLLTRLITAPLLSLIVSQKFIVLMAKRDKKDLTIAHQLLAAGKIKPVIGRRYRLNEAAEAVRHLATGHARGKVIITMEESTGSDSEPG
jgi:NADPH:quinone reductase-like Zn-dependent oxidoreductase